MNAIEDNVWSRSFKALAQRLPRPRNVLAISAHWFTQGTFVTGNEKPETLYDFGGFPDELSRITYPAPGDPELAARLVKLLGEEETAVRTDWGFDHGTWTVLRYLLPEADIPVVQLSVDLGALPEQHLEIGRRLADLREEGTLILASGNIVHNLRHAFTMMARRISETPGWAAAFDRDVARAAGQLDGKYLSGLLDSDLGRIAHPTPDHYLPLLYVIGAAGESGSVTFPVEGFDAGSLSMRAVMVE